MRFQFAPDDLAFRDELRQFLAAALPDGWTGPADESKDDDWTLHQDIRRKLADRGWLVMHWPVEYGGRDASAMRNIVFAEEMAYQRAPGNDRCGTRMLGPTLMLHGTAEQKTKDLPDIARGGIQWCQGYSEPDAGSDLASLQTRAVLEGDRFIVNGVEKVDLDTLLAESDVVTMHCVHTRETDKMMNAERFAQMKPTAIFVNTSRGGNVDEAAMAQALKDDVIAYAAIDAFADEPLPADSPLPT